jgi:quinol monooxygenase YgiN
MKNEEGRMIEVRSLFLARMRDIGIKRGALDLCKELREKVLRAAKWQGRVQQMLLGHAQQSLFVWASQWEDLAAWETAMAHLKNLPEYQKWVRRADHFWVYSEPNEVLTILDPKKSPLNISGKIEVRSAYIAQAENSKRAKNLVQQHCPSRLQNWAVLYDTVGQSLFVLSSTWESLAAWEQGMRTAEDEEFESWYKDWMDTVEFGGAKEVFRNL